MTHVHLMRQIVAVGFVGLLAAATATAQGPGRGPRDGSRTGPQYDPTKEVTVKGTVTAVHSDVRPLGRHLTLKTDAESMDVALGPAWFLSEQKLTLAAGDSVEVTGAKVAAHEGGPTFVARLVKKGDATVALRNEQGIPLWSKGPRR